MYEMREAQLEEDKIAQARMEAELKGRDMAMQREQNIDPSFYGLSRQQRRRIEREQSKQAKKSGIRPNISDDEKVTVSRAELKRMVDEKIKERQAELDAMSDNLKVLQKDDAKLRNMIKQESQKQYAKMMVQHFYLLAFALHDETFGIKYGEARVNRFFENLGNLYDDVFADGDDGQVTTTDRYTQIVEYVKTKLKFDMDEFTKSNDERDLSDICKLTPEGEAVAQHHDLLFDDGEEEDDLWGEDEEL